jgi:hypothetical protein
MFQQILVKLLDIQFHKTSFNDSRAVPYEQMDKQSYLIGALEGWEGE